LNAISDSKLKEVGCLAMQNNVRYSFIWHKKLSHELSFIQKRLVYWIYVVPSIFLVFIFTAE